MTATLNATGVLDGSIYVTARAWVNFRGDAPVVIRADYNVNTVTRAATGDYTVTFSTSLGDGNFAYAVSAGENNGANYWASGSLAAPTATTLRFGTGTGSRVDMQSCNAIVCR